MIETVTLYRPVGLKELELLKQSGYKKFPPRLPEQPIFYPVLNFEYAEQIAREWNTRSLDSDYEGFITRFEIRKDFISQYDIQQVGSSVHLEYWINADDLDSFNDNIVGLIDVIKSFKK